LPQCARIGPADADAADIAAMTIFDSSLFADAMADRRFWLAFAISTLSGLVRGFSGFGSALIYMPLIAAVYEPRVAAVTLLLIDSISTAPFTLRSFRQCTWREILPMFAACVIAIPLGATALVVLDPIVLRWFMVATILLLLAILMSGWRYQGRPSLPLTLGVGLFSGFGGGAVQIAGPAVIIYWLGGANNTVTVRANMMVYFLLMDVVMLVVYGLRGLFTAELTVLALLLGIPFFAATAAGALLFHSSSDRSYRRIAYIIIAVSAIVSLPLFDPWLR
jgi:uncharacterized protein